MPPRKKSVDAPTPSRKRSSSVATPRKSTRSTVVVESPARKTKGTPARSKSRARTVAPVEEVVATPIRTPSRRGRPPGSTKKEKPVEVKSRSTSRSSAVAQPSAHTSASNNEGVCFRRVTALWQLSAFLVLVYYLVAAVKAIQVKHKLPVIMGFLTQQVHFLAVDAFLILFIATLVKKRTHAIKHYTLFFFLFVLGASTLVCAFFWCLYFYKRELIFPKGAEAIYSSNLNLFQHLYVTLIVYLELARTLYQRRKDISNGHPVVEWPKFCRHVSFAFAYAFAFALYAETYFVKVTGGLPYPFLDVMTFPQRIALYAGVCLIAAFPVYVIQKCVTKCIDKTSIAKKKRK